MRPKPLVYSGLLLAALVAGSGCTHHYTGGLSLGAEDQQAVKAYHEFKQKQKEQLEDARLAQRRNGPTVFEEEAMHKPSDGGEPTIQQTSARQLIPMSLYGQTHTGDYTQRTSPLDGIHSLRRITYTSEGADFDPELDPSGTILVYASTRHRETSDLYLKQVTGSAVTQITNDPSNEVMPTISPDGQRVAFCSDRTGNWDIYVMDIRGGQAIQITDDPTDDIHPSFSQDGQKLVYCSRGSQSGQWEMVIIDVEKPTAKNFIGYGLFPTWSPTSDKILFQRARQRGTRWFSIWTMLIVDGQAMSPTEIAASANAAVITPDWSPDGNHVVFCTVIEPENEGDNETPTQADVWIMGADGNGKTRLTSGHFLNLQPSWAADGSIFFVSNRSMDGAETVWAMSPEQALRVAGQSINDDDIPSAMVPTQ